MDSVISLLVTIFVMGMVVLLVLVGLVMAAAATLANGARALFTMCKSKTSNDKNDDS